MSKKRGPNSPMESEKTKQSTSAAASTLGMAAMLNVVSSVHLAEYENCKMSKKRGANSLSGKNEKRTKRDKLEARTKLRSSNKGEEIVREKKNRWFCLRSRKKKLEEEEN